MLLVTRMVGMCAQVKQLSTLVLVIAEEFRDMDFVSAVAADARVCAYVSHCGILGQR